ncbi:unnamed protein product, partial [Iphiclides podalirius]
MLNDKQKFCSSRDAVRPSAGGAVLSGGRRGATARWLPLNTLAMKISAELSNGGGTQVARRHAYLPTSAPHIPPFLINAAMPVLHMPLACQL